MFRSPQVLLVNMKRMDTRVNTCVKEIAPRCKRPEIWPEHGCFQDKRDAMSPGKANTTVMKRLHDWHKSQIIRNICYIFVVNVLVTPQIVFSHATTFMHMSLMYFRLKLLKRLWYLVVIVLSVPFRLTASDYPFGIL